MNRARRNDRNFTKEFIALYEKHRCLWDSNNPDVHDSTQEVALQELENKLKEANPRARRDSVIHKISYLRKTYYRELEMEMKRKKYGLAYRPPSWFYDYMHFLPNPYYPDIRNLLENVENQQELPSLNLQVTEQASLSDQPSAASDSIALVPCKTEPPGFCSISEIRGDQHAIEFPQVDLSSGFDSSAPSSKKQRISLQDESVSEEKYPQEQNMAFNEDSEKISEAGSSTCETNNAENAEKPSVSMEVTHSILKALQPVLQPKDECELYCDLLAKRLKKFDIPTREMLMHHIDSLIFEERNKSEEFQPKSFGKLMSDVNVYSPYYHSTPLSTPPNSNRCSPEYSSENRVNSQRNNCIQID